MEDDRQDINHFTERVFFISLKNSNSGQLSAFATFSEGILQYT